MGTRDFPGPYTRFALRLGSGELISPDLGATCILLALDLGQNLEFWGFPEFWAAVYFLI